MVKISLCFFQEYIILEPIPNVSYLVRVFVNIAEGQPRIAMPWNIFSAYFRGKGVKFLLTHNFKNVWNKMNLKFFSKVYIRDTQHLVIDFSFKAQSTRKLSIFQEWKPWKASYIAGNGTFQPKLKKWKYPPRENLL